ncbi:MAG: DNA mismatch repair protein MutS [Endomicrobia bacterium]|nr:DNA mismatch repair protein MutS [Endomicrobiia bacterium]
MNLKNSLNNTLTPLMQQYQDIKKQYQDCILLFRLGDFYEMFGDDAIKASPVLGVVLTKRQEVPMCGVPFHSVNNYISKLLSANYKVAICEQIEDPKLAKGVVKREVVRVITPGTIIEENLLDATKNNFLTSIDFVERKNIIFVGISTVDISTGDFFVTQFEDTSFTKIIDELNRLSPSEIVAKDSQKDTIYKIIQNYKNIHIEFIEDWFFDSSTAMDKIINFYKIHSIESFGLSTEKHKLILNSISGLFEYLQRTQKQNFPKLKPIKLYNLENYMLLDNSCIKNLELVENLFDKTSKNTLFSSLNLTQTTMGTRLLRNWILKPLLNIGEISKRHNIVELFYNNDLIRIKIREKLKLIADIERITNRISSKNASPKDLLTLKDSLETIFGLNLLLKDLFLSNQLIEQKICHWENIENGQINKIIEIIQKSINPEAPSETKKGNVIKYGYNKELDELRNLYSHSKEWLLKYQEEQRASTNIQSLKVGYTSVFGYYIEITKSNLQFVPKEYIRKQTLKNAERFTTTELKEFEDKILSAEEKILQLEEFLFNQILNEISQYTQVLFQIAQEIAEIDVLSNFAEISKRNKYIRPLIDNSYILHLKASRHPVIEQMLPQGKFIPNDVCLDGENIKLVVLTGPNMAGKSTYIRQVALCIIMAQIGCFVPAEYAKIGIVDKIFARIGASDYLAKGLSTFMVEMQETANILHNATNKSLIILDEIGRGTSTYDGISIAWATAEYLVNPRYWNNSHYTPKTLFATHYFELTELEEKYSGIRNFNVSVKEYKDNVIFLYKVIEGCSDKSYGIHVAKLAGLPDKVILRAWQILKYLHNTNMNTDISMISKSQQLQLDILTDKDINEEKTFFPQILEEIKKIDINNLTPLEAFNYIIKWKRIINFQVLKEENIDD